MRRSSDANLPENLLAILPADPHDQLDIARKITWMAVTSRVEALEAEAGKLRQQLAERELMISTLQERVRELQETLQQSTVRLLRALDEQEKLTMEKNVLTASVTKLKHEVAKLGTFKRTLMQSLHEDGETQPQSSDDKGLGDLLSVSDSSLPSLSSLRVGRTVPSTPPNLTPQHTPRRSIATSPKGTSVAVSPEKQSAKASSKWQSFEEGTFSLPSSLSASQNSTAPNSPPHSGSHPARTARVDGKEFFRRARNCLSYAQFRAFLVNIKELNALKQTKEETLKKAIEIFGSDNKDLYIAFEGLLSRHLHRQG